MSNKTSRIVCQALLMQCPQEKRQALLKFLSPSKLEELQELPLPSCNPLENLNSLEKQISLVHSSWLVPFLRSRSESEIRLFLSALKPEQIKELQKSLLFTNQFLFLTPIAKRFLQETLWKTMGGDEKIPPSWLPQFSLNALLGLEDVLFNKIFFLLGLRDLSHEMHRIIETAKIKKIYNVLKQEENLFLKKLMLKKEPISFKKLPLSEWDGEEPSLRKILQGRGLNRLAKALYGHSEDLIWYVSHRMEAEMGKQFLRLVTPLDHPRAQSVLISQVEEALNYLQHYTSGNSA